MEKLTIEYVKEQFEKEGYVLLTTKYINAHQKLDYICSNKHKHSISWSNWQKSSKCPFCYGNAQLTIGYIKSEFKKEEYTLLTTEYINCYQKLEYICLNGHRHSVSWTNWQVGKRCPYCANRPPINIEFVRSEFEKRGYILLTNLYENNEQKLDYICKDGHKHNISWKGWQQGQRCPYCAVIASEGEIEVRNFVKSLGIEVSSNDRNQIFNPETGIGFELDIFMPILNKAVEYNGEYWHKDKSRDLLKRGLCKLKGVDLLTIWDNEWLNDVGKCKNKIMKFLFSGFNF